MRRYTFEEFEEEFFSEAVLLEELLPDMITETIIKKMHSRMLEPDICIRQHQYMILNEQAVFNKMLINVEVLYSKKFKDDIPLEENLFLAWEIYNVVVFDDESEYLLHKNSSAMRADVSPSFEQN